MDTKRIPKAFGGAHPAVQGTSERLAMNPNLPFVAQRIYAAPSVAGFDETDPRYAGKQNQVENIYMPSQLPQDAKPRPGWLQAMNWLLQGKFE